MSASGAASETQRVLLINFGISGIRQISMLGPVCRGVWDPWNSANLSQHGLFEDFESEEDLTKRWPE